MNKPAVVAAAAIALGSLMALLDFISGPSLNLLAVNSTILSALTIMSVALLATPGTVPAGKETRESFDGKRRTPMVEMVGLLKGARDGYTLNRKEIALVLRSAVDSKMGDGASPPPHETVDAYLRSALGPQSFSEFFSEDEWRSTRVESSKNYLARLKDVVTTLKQSLEF